MSDPTTEATHIEVDAGVRYWEDARVNGVEEDDDSPSIFGVSDSKTRWQVKIGLADGSVENWPEGMTADIHYKVCDGGEYWLTNAVGNRIAKWNGYYVPDAFLCHGDNGYGDYIIFSVDGAGKIADYECPSINVGKNDDDSGWTLL